MDLVGVRVCQGARLEGHLLKLILLVFLQPLFGCHLRISEITQSRVCELNSCQCGLSLSLCVIETFKELSEFYKAKSLQKVNSAKPKKDPPQMMMVYCFC